MQNSSLERWWFSSNGIYIKLKCITPRILEWNSSQPATCLSPNKKAMASNLEIYFAIFWLKTIKANGLDK